MAELPVTPYQRNCTCEDERIARIELELNENEDGWIEVPVFLEDTGNPKDLLKAKQLKKNHYAKKVIKGTATAEEIASYNALLLDLKDNF